MWHDSAVKETLAQLKTNESSGLSEDEVLLRLEKEGTNILPREKKKAWWQLFLSQFKNPLVGILLVAAIITALLKEWTDTTVIMVVVILNSIIGFWQEFRSSNILEKLQRLITVKARVMRDGKIREIDAEKLVSGDIIILKTGMKVPADARIIICRELETNEALLTGESSPVKKKDKTLLEKTPLADRINMVFMGTVVETGEAKAVVVATGAKTEIGQIAKLTQAAEEEKTPLQEKLGRLGKIITVFVAVSAIIILIIGLLEQRGFVEVFTTAVAVAVAAIPEGLLAALSVILAVAGQRIFKEKGLIKHLTAAETLGSTNVICTDKTGTLTEGKMKVDKIINYGPLQETLLISALANAAITEETEKGTKVRGEPTDQAKMEVFLEKGGKLEQVLTEKPRLAELEFDPTRKYMTSFHRLPNNKIGLYVAGSPEVLLQLSSSLKKKVGREKLNKRKLEALKSQYETLAKSGFRMIGLGYKEISETKTKINFNDNKKLTDLVENIVFYGFLAIRDPIRKDVHQSIKTAREAGVKVIMVTGDHKFTAQAIGQELKFNTAPEAIIEGSELDSLSEEELEMRVDQIEIYARVNPKHKMRIINAWQTKDMAVAMTGDGINDAPALKSADIGIAVGSGTDVTKEAADLVLMDNSFSLIPQAIRQGRIAFDNIRKVTLLLLVGSFTELILIMTALILRIPLPITAVQILWANLVEDGLPTFSLAFEPGEKGIMKRKPLKRREGILDKESMAIVFIVGLITDFILVGLFLFFYHFTNLSIEHIRTIIFAALSTDVLFYVFAFKSLQAPITKTNLINNRFLILASIIGFILIGAVIYVPALNVFMETTPLNLMEIGLILGLALLKVGLIEIVKYFFREKIELN
jgi:Ca2+-transporting ATPase